MGLADLMTMDQVRAARAGKPLWKSSVLRMDEKAAVEKVDAKFLAQWRAAVRRRDRGRCRVCGIKTVQTLELDPKRGEAHHIVSRTCQVTRYDVRNGLHTCLRCHSRFKARKLFVTGKASQMFKVGLGITAKSYLDASYPLEFVERKPDV